MKKKDQPEEQEEEKIELDASLTFSSREILQHADFETMTNEELAQAKKLIANLRLPIPEILTRRHKADPHGRIVDMRAYGSRDAVTQPYFGRTVMSFSSAPASAQPR